MRYSVLVLLVVTSSAFASVPQLPFVANEGQADARVAFTADTFGGTVFVTHDAEIVYALRAGDEPVVLRERFAGSHCADVRGLAAGTARVRRFAGNDRTAWQRDVATYDRIALGTPWSGIAVQLRAGGDTVEKIFEVAAHADPKRISVELDGAKRLHVDGEGSLVAETTRGPVRFSAPIAWQGEGDSRRDVRVAYTIAGNRYGFRLGHYDPTEPVTIDPALVYSSYLGGDAIDSAFGIAVDAQGSAYITGLTFSANFPLAEAWDGMHDLQNDVFVSKLTPDGAGLVFSTFIGGSSFEDARSIALDANGNVWITGITFSNDFPTPGSTSSYSGNADAFAARLSSTGAVTFARYLGGSNRDEGRAITVDSANNPVILGGTTSTNFQPQPAGVQPVHGGGFDAFIVRLNAGLPDTPSYVSYFGGNGDDCAFFLGCDVEVDTTGSLYLTMDTTSTNLPVPNAFAGGNAYNGGAVSGFGGDAWVGRVQLNSNTVIWGSYVGGSGWDEPYALELDGTGGVWIAGDTTSANFPAVAALSGQGGGIDGWVMRLTWSGGPVAVSFSTKFGGTGTEHIAGVEVISPGQAWIGGTTTSTNLTTASPLQAINRGKRDGFFAQLAWNGTALSLPFATYHGGSDDDGIVAIAPGPGGDLFFAGDTQAIDHPVARPIQATAVGGGDSVAGRITLSTLTPPLLTENGYGISPRGTLRVLLVFAQVDFTLCPSADIYPTPDVWLPNAIPPDAAAYFDHYLAPGAQPQGYLTKYYYEGSLGQYLVLGDYLPNVVTVPCTNFNGWGGHANVIAAMNAMQQPLETANINPTTGLHYRLDDFDFWGDEGAGLPKSNYPNGAIDAMLIIWRNNNAWCGACGLGLQPLGSYPLHHKTTKQIGSYNAIHSGEGAFGITISEYFHALFGGNNWHTGSGAGQHTFPFPGVGSYSTTQGQVSNTVAGYDRFQMGWKNPYKRFLLSALDTSGTEVPSDVSVQSRPFGATFVLRDYYSTGDMVRIRLPHFDWQTGGDVKNQYLWLENHQRVLLFDRSKWESTPGKEAWSKGMYVQLQVGKDHKSGPDEWALYDPPNNQPNALASWLLQYTAEGNHDFLYRFDQAQAPSWAHCNWMNANVPTERAQGLANPFTGFSDVYRYIDSAQTIGGLPTTPTLRPLGDGTLLSNDEVQTGLSEFISSSFFANCHAAGDRGDGFNSTDSQNLLLGIGTNPAAVPAYTHTSAYGHGGPQTWIAGYENRVIRLNNLRVAVTGENVDGNGAIRVDIAWDKPRIADDVRWTGNVELKKDLLDPLNRTMQIELAADKQICLDRGFSATKYIANPGEGLFTDPTLLTLRAGTVTRLETNAELAVLNGSQIAAEVGATLNLDAGATIAFTPQPAPGQWAACPRPPCTPAPAGMVTWWKLDETTGAAAADNAGSNDGLRVNNPTPAPGQVQGALQFAYDQFNPQHVRVPHAAALNFGTGSFTFDAWLNPANPGIVLSKHDDVINRGYEVFLDIVVGNSSMLHAGMRINGTFVHPSNCTLSRNQWRHLTLVVERPANQVHCYLGGTLVSTQNIFINGTSDNTKDLFIGRSEQFAGLGPYTGVIDEVELFNKALAQPAIGAIVASGSGGKCSDGCTQRPSGLDAWWPLDEPAGGSQAFDLVSGATGTLFGATRLQPGFNENALSFDGVDDYVEVPNHPAADVGAGDFTIDLWVRANAGAAGVEVLVEKRQQTQTFGAHGWSVFLLNGRIGVQLADGIGDAFCSTQTGVSSCTNFISNSVVADGAWHFVGVSVDRDHANGGAIVVDGQRVFTFNPTVRTGSLSNAAPLRFGRRTYDGGGHFAGALDEIEIFHRALSDAELGALHTAGAGGKCKFRVDTPSAISVCPADSAVDVPITICNDSATARTFFYTLHGLPGGDAVTGTGCNLPGLTSFTYQSPAPVTVPAMSCATVIVRAGRPAGMTAQNQTSCYEAAAWDTGTGTRVRDTGTLRAQFLYCPIIDDDVIEVARTASVPQSFAVRNVTGKTQLYRYVVSGYPEGQVRFGRSTIGQPLRGTLRVAPNQTGRVDFRVGVPQLPTGSDAEYRIFIGDDLERPAGTVALRLPPRSGTAPPPDLAVEVTGSGMLRAGERTVYEIRVRNAGSRPPGARATLRIDLPPGLESRDTTGRGLACGRAIATENGNSLVTCTAETEALAPGGVMILRLGAVAGFRPEPGMRLCARVEIGGDIHRANNEHCQQRDYAAPILTADLGDAPDSSNHRGSIDRIEEDVHRHPEQPPPGLVVPNGAAPDHHRHPHTNPIMFVYGRNVIGRFPTVFDPNLGSPTGPIHWQPRAAFWLGREVTTERDADRGPDEDGVTNIEPNSSSADRDGRDDGMVASTLRLPACGTAAFDVTVTARNLTARPLLNVWFDFNQDGDWSDTFTCTANGRAITVSEWAVRNHGVTLRRGVTTVRTPSFNAAGKPRTWMRITLADAPAPAEGDGRGPVAGYRFGETEDYLLR